jgi:hypothetical protein
MERRHEVFHIHKRERNGDLQLQCPPPLRDTDTVSFDDVTSVPRGALLSAVILDPVSPSIF